WKQGKLAEARSNFRNGLNYPIDEADADKARYTIAQINEKMGDLNSPSMPASTDAAQTTFRGDQNAEKGEWDTAVAAYTKAIQQNPKSALPYIHRAYAYMTL